MEASELPEGSDAVECDAVDRMLVVGETVIPVPPPGLTVTMHMDYAGGGSITSEASTALDGTVTYDSETLAPLEAENPPTTTLPDEDLTTETDPIDPGPDENDPSIDPKLAVQRNGCDRNRFNWWKPAKVYGSFPMRVSTDDAGEPAGGTTSDTASALRRSLGTWENENSPCFSSDQSAVPNLFYDGLTTTQGDFVDTASGTACAPRADIDSRSSVDIGDLEPNALVAGTCTWTTGHDGLNEVIQADIRFNTTDYDFTYTPGDGDCDSNDFDVISILTHELGHVLGFDDLYDPANRYLTMSGRVNNCTTYLRNLGRGDVLGLRERY
ncbi:hypothetical protein DJ010_10540 [Nocardioides silvaticus]|uniref:Peptidase M10 metallopeptidase domain-containing protein n=1 Tax=Nocardioides silvaticus TaxID=2201891 RepID=A0A316THY2_9ACTN|nr:hypothetical protein DJ010_10540 [Nocardioides silvaticus]